MDTFTKPEVFRQESKSNESVVSEPSTSTSSLISKRVSEKKKLCKLFVGCSRFLWMSDSAGILFGLRRQYLSNRALKSSLFSGISFPYHY